MSSKTEYPPLLMAGLHKMTMPELDQLTVAKFPNSIRRPALWAEFEKLVGTITQINLQCQIWIDGSFLTSKPEPADIDFVIEVPVIQFENLNPAQDSLVSKLAIRAFESAGLHSFVIASCPIGHKDFAASRQSRDYWTKSFGFSLVGKQPKGIAVVEGRI